MQAGQRLAEFAAGLAATGKNETRDVPCGGSNACCWADRIEVEPGDDLTRLATIRDADGARVLRHREDGACIHLTAHGCGVREHRPAVCRSYDCRVAGAVGLIEEFSNGHATPGWFFEIETPADRALALALRLGAMRVVRAATDGEFDVAEAALAAWTLAREYLNEIQALAEKTYNKPMRKARGRA